MCSWLGLTAAIFSSPASLDAKSVLWALISVVAIIGYASLVVRRCHDVGRSGWWGAVALIPYVNDFADVALLLAPGDAGPNAYGPSPSS